MSEQVTSQWIDEQVTSQRPSNFRLKHAEQVTSGLEWRKPREEGYLKELPSGNWAKLRPVSPDLLLATGDIPDILTPLVVKMVFEGADAQELGDLTKPEKVLTHAKETVDFFNTICRLAFVEPKIVDKPTKDNEISIDDIEISDRGFVFQLCTQPVEVLRSFRLESARNVESIPDGENDGSQAEQSNGN